MKTMVKWGIAILFCLLMTACGSDAITQETKDAVSKKTSEVLALYSSMEQTIQENSIEVDSSFGDMKQQLLDMSAKVTSKLEDTTELDGKQSLEQLQKLEDNLKEIKKVVDQYIVKTPDSGN